MAPSLSPCIYPLHSQNPFPVCSRLDSAQEGHCHQIPKAEGSRSHCSLHAAMGKSSNNHCWGLSWLLGSPLQDPHFSAMCNWDPWCQFPEAAGVLLGNPCFVLLAPGVTGGTSLPPPQSHCLSVLSSPSPSSAAASLHFPVLTSLYSKYLEWLLSSWLNLEWYKQGCLHILVWAHEPTGRSNWNINSYE